LPRHEHRTPQLCTLLCQNHSLVKILHKCNFLNHSESCFIRDQKYCSGFLLSWIIFSNLLLLLNCSIYLYYDPRHQMVSQQMVSLTFNLVFSGNHHPPQFQFLTNFFFPFWNLLHQVLFLNHKTSGLPLMTFKTLSNHQCSPALVEKIILSSFYSISQ
jgi:hypothetical protein